MRSWWEDLEWWFWRRRLRRRWNANTVIWPDRLFCFRLNVARDELSQAVFNQTYGGKW